MIYKYIVMPNYLEQFNKLRKTASEKKKVKQKIKEPKNEASYSEWTIMLFIAVIADLMVTFGFILAIVLVVWHVYKFKKFPTKKLIGSGAFEIFSLGFLPGWTGFIIATFIKQEML